MDKNELDFKTKLAETLQQPPFNHQVYSHESPCQFNIHKSSGYVDLYIRTSPQWDHHDKFPIIGIETKLAKSMGWLIDAISQVGRYKNDLASAIYTIKGKQVPAPTLFLVATPDSTADGFVYKWMPPEFQLANGLSEGHQSVMQWGGWFALTALYERLLMKNGAALLKREGVFFTNLKGNGGAITRYCLETNE